MKIIKLKQCQIVGFIYIFILLFTGCTSIKLVGDYDERIDTGVTALQKATETHLLAIKEKGASYASTKDFYEKSKVEISSLRVRADATERNSLTVKMLDKLASNIDKLEKAHKEGIQPEEVELFRGGFNSQFTAILTFELAKKRGEKPDQTKAAEKPTPVTVEP
jgi:hypothetical protein